MTPVVFRRRATADLDIPQFRFNCVPPSFPKGRWCGAAEGGDVKAYLNDGRAESGSVDSWVRGEPAPQCQANFASDPLGIEMLKRYSGKESKR
jgi:hypothetical protein